MGLNSLTHVILFISVPVINYSYKIYRTWSNWSTYH